MTRENIEKSYASLDRTDVIPREYYDIHLVDGVEFAYYPLGGNIAVNLSGGADSALGTYILCKMIQEYNLDTQVEVITFVRGAWGKPWQKPIAIQVFDKLKNMFPDIIREQHFHFISPTLEHGTIGSFEVLENKSIDQVIVGDFNIYFKFVEKKAEVIYNFTTMNPDTVDDGPKDRQKEKIQKDWYYATVIRPFNSVTKDWVIKQYIDNDIMDLLEVTRSCEASIDHKVMTNIIKENPTSKSLPTCGECFWCKEKQWAMEQNGVC